MKPAYVQVSTGAQAAFLGYSRRDQGSCPVSHWASLIKMIFGGIVRIKEAPKSVYTATMDIYVLLQI
jgi:hypothetical protein